MVRIFISLLALSFATPVFALPNGRYTCKIFPTTAKKDVVQFSFEMKKGEIECQKLPDDELCQSWFTFSPADQDQFWLDGLYDGGYDYNKKGDWEVFADSDGCDMGKLVLYKNSGFTKGFIRNEFRCSTGSPKSAGKVFCEKKQ